MIGENDVDIDRKESNVVELGNLYTSVIFDNLVSRGSCDDLLLISRCCILDIHSPS